MTKATQPILDHSYDLFTHHHRFAGWVAARAVQRGFKGATTKRLFSALENVVLKWLEDHHDAEFDQEAFDAEHHQLCKLLCQELSADNEVEGVTHGRAAKLVAMYLKTMVITGGWACQLAGVIHPPIDRKLLESKPLRDALSKQKKCKSLSSISWTTLDCGQYTALIERLREALAPGEDFWMLERYWHPAESSEER